MGGTVPPQGSEHWQYLSVGPSSVNPLLEVHCVLSRSLEVPLRWTLRGSAEGQCVGGDAPPPWGELFPVRPGCVRDAVSLSFEGAQIGAQGGGVGCFTPEGDRLDLGLWV